MGFHDENCNRELDFLGCAPTRSLFYPTPKLYSVQGFDRNRHKVEDNRSSGSSVPRPSGLRIQTEFVPVVKPTACQKTVFGYFCHRGSCSLHSAAQHSRCRQLCCWVNSASNALIRARRIWHLSQRRFRACCFLVAQHRLPFS